MLWRAFESPTNNAILSQLARLYKHASKLVSTEICGDTGRAEFDSRRSRIHARDVFFTELHKMCSHTE
jgi:hypothetical protein